MRLTMVDVVLAMLILIGMLAGHRRGFLAAALDLLTVLASIAFAFVFHGVPAAWLRGHWRWLDPWLPLLSFVLLALLAMSLLGTLAYHLARLFPGRVHVNGLNRALGIVPGAANGVIWSVLALLLVTSMPLLGGFAQYARDGVIGSRLAGPAEALSAAVEPIFAPAVRQVERALTVPVGSNQRVDLDFRLAKARPRPDLEARMLELVNAERARQQLKPLEPRKDLTQVAREHSADMLARGYFSHYTPEGESLADRLREDEVRYLVAGENLAFAPSLKTAHEGLMDSPGHRANILRPQFGHLGVGVLDAGRHGIMVTQNFSN